MFFLLQIPVMIPEISHRFGQYNRWVFLYSRLVPGFDKICSANSKKKINDGFLKIPYAACLDKPNARLLRRFFAPFEVPLGRQYRQHPQHLRINHLFKHALSFLLVFFRILNIEKILTQKCIPIKWPRFFSACRLKPNSSVACFFS